MMAEYGILGSAYHTMEYVYCFNKIFNFPMRNYWIEPFIADHYKLSSNLKRRFPKSKTNFNDLIPDMRLHYRHSYYVLDCALHDQIHLIKTYSFNKVNEFATFLLNFILDNEIDNYLSWDLIWMNEKVNIIIDIMKLLLEFKNKYAVNSKDIGLVYLFALACTMTKYNYTIKDIQDNLIKLIIDFKWVIINNYCLFGAFEKNLISLYANALTISRMINNNYGGVNE